MVTILPNLARFSFHPFKMDLFQAWVGARRGRGLPGKWDVPLGYKKLDLMFSNFSNIHLDVVKYFRKYVANKFLKAASR